mgnify:CR=1 FL=1
MYRVYIRMYPKGLMIKVAEFYFYRKLPQSKIAQELGLSISTVSRILAQAMEEDIIQVTIRDAEKNFNDVGKKLKDIYHLKDVVIIHTPSPKEQHYIKKLLGKAGSETFLRLARPGNLIGIGAGETILELVESLTHSSRLFSSSLVPLMGGWGVGGVAYEVNNLIAMMAGVLRCSYRLLLCPAIVSTAQVRELFLQEEPIRRVTELWEQLDVVVFSLGPEVEAGHYPQLLPDKDVVPQMRALGAVGDVVGRFLDDKGQEIPSNFRERLITIPIEVLSKVPIRIGLGGGDEKVRSILASLRSGLVNVLVTDYETSLRILESNFF